MSPLVRWGGAAALALVAVLTLGTVAALALRAEPGRGLGPAEWAALRFTLWQALLSAALSCLAGGAGGAGAGAAAVPGARGAGGAARGAVPAAGDRRGVRHRRDLGAGRARQPRAGGGGPAGARRLRAGRRGAGARVLQRGAGGAAAAAGLAGDPGRDLPAGGAARVRPARRVPADRAADARSVLPGRLRAGVPALHDQLRGGADPRRRAAGDDGRARDLPGAALRLRPRAGGLAGADPVRALRRGGAGRAAAVGRRRLRGRGQRRGRALGRRPAGHAGAGRRGAASRWRCFSGCRSGRWRRRGWRRWRRGCRRRSGRRRRGASRWRSPRRRWRSALGLALAALRRRAAGAGRRPARRGGGADDARRLAVRDRHRALHPAVPARRPVRCWRCR